MKCAIGAREFFATLNLSGEPGALCYMKCVRGARSTLPHEMGHRSQVVLCHIKCVGGARVNCHMAASRWLSVFCAWTTFQYHFQFNMYFYIDTVIVFFTCVCLVVLSRRV